MGFAQIEREHFFQPHSDVKIQQKIRTEYCCQNVDLKFARLISCWTNQILDAFVGNSFLFQMGKTSDFYLVPSESYSKKTTTGSILFNILQLTARKSRSTGSCRISGSWLASSARNELSYHVHSSQSISPQMYYYSRNIFQNTSTINTRFEYHFSQSSHLEPVVLKS